ncbi:succinylglutamate desuccinylase/aspartoacylase family protein [Candidatus Gottesmanbacteria bacterium]|nr:succinylglutamate desuccinylase/aspartoacylase family protein [Candidatus Gottesmanbacteria bacterium]
MKKYIQNIRVNLGSTIITVPVFDRTSDLEGKTLLVTAGMDGDEYASIDAAYRMIEELRMSSFHGRIIIIPIVNSPGFEKETSYNPLDGKYPKLVGIGKKDGTESDRLVDWIVDTYTLHADMWLDLHGGNLTEVMAPFLWAWETKTTSIDILMRSFCERNSPEFAVFEPYSFYGKAAMLSQSSCGYICAESGGSCVRSEEAIEQHWLWVRDAMHILNMVSSGSSTSKKVPLYQKYRQYSSKIQGMWYPESTIIRSIQKGEFLGEVKSFDLSKTEKMFAKEDAQILWIKEGMKSSNKEILVATASTPW